MDQARQLRLALPVAAFALLGALAVTRPGLSVAADPPWDPPPCPATGTAAAGSPSGGAWYRMDATLDREGTLVGQRVWVGRLDGSAARAIDLPTESFASGPVGSRVLVGSDDGSASRLRLVDVERRCALDVARETAVIRSALLSADGRTIYEHRVERASRADAGVWRRSVATGDANRVLPGLGADAAFGPTFATDIRFPSEGGVLVASCGPVACRVRIVDPHGIIRAVAPTGHVLGATGGRVIAYRPCAGLPCAIEAVDEVSGDRRELVADAGAAAVSGGSQPQLVHEAAVGLVALDLETLAAAPVPAADGIVPIRGGSGATSGATVAPDALPLGPFGRALGPASLLTFDPATRTAHGIGEVQR